MHRDSLKWMKKLLSEIPNRKEKSVCDVGSYDKNGSYVEIVKELGFLSYFGIDIREGKNVDLVVPESGNWFEVVGRKFDVVISGQVAEHVKRPWLWIKQVRSITASRGFVVIIAPFMFEIHEYPIDCWRFCPDGMRVILEEGGFEVCKVGLGDARVEFKKETISIKKDCFGVGKCCT